MSNSVQPHRRQPTRLTCPWDSPGKNTGEGCHFLLQCRKGKVKVKSLSRVQLLATPWTAAYQVPPSIGFSRLEYWRRLLLPSPSLAHCDLKHSFTCLIVFWALKNTSFSSAPGILKKTLPASRCCESLWLLNLLPSKTASDNLNHMVHLSN